MPIRRNSLGRFRSRSRRSGSRRSRSSSASSGRVLSLSSPSQYRAVESLIRRGPMTIMLIYSPTCPHCHTYMPLWKEMCAMKRRRSHMVSMKADVYDQTPMSERQSVSGVPTVLFVRKDGSVEVAQEPRNREVMSEAVTKGVSEVEAAANVAAPPSVAAPPQMPSVMSATSAAEPSSVSEISEPLPGTEMPAGTTITPNPLEALPAQPVRSESVTAGVQYGGNPWAAFLATAAQAAPAAVLAGAYAISKARRRTVRSSGLPAPEHSAKWRRLRAKLASRRRR